MLWLHASKRGTRNDHVVENTGLRLGIDFTVDQHRHALGVTVTRHDVQVPGFSEVIQPLESKKRSNLNLSILVLITRLDVIIQSRVPVVTCENPLAAHLLPSEITQAGG